MPPPLRFGLWYDFRNPPRWRQDPTRLYEGIFQQIARAEQLGWHDVWLSEHHFIDDGYTPSMLALACAIGARTQRIRIGTSVLLLPLHEPLRVAEDAATADVVSGGRLELGVGVGYRRGEFEGFGVPARERAARMDEAVPLLRRLLAGERVTHRGRFHRYRDVELHPRPVQPAMRLWMGGFSPPAVRRAARLGDAYIAIGPVAPLIQLYRSELQSLGRDPEAHEVAAGLAWLLVARDPERRWREAEAHLLYQINLYASWFGEVGMSVAATASSRADLETQGVLIVTPEQAIESIQRYRSAQPVTRFYGWTLPPGLPPEWSDEHLELMAREVMPSFQAAAPTVAPEAR
jgi:alkanesulfonate monooxygenase SsuD/methylene tetrahydromethanopterin reductase-like flavin-dependent oxidoreductase (luciferase family)